MKEEEKIPLLSPKPFGEYSPEEFRQHVKGLNYVKPKRVSTSKRKVVPEVSWKRNLKGTLVIRVKRKPQVITQSEFDSLAKESGEPMNELWLRLAKRKIKVDKTTGERK